MIPLIIPKQPNPMQIHPIVRFLEDELFFENKNMPIPTTKIINPKIILICKPFLPKMLSSTVLTVLSKVRSIILPPYGLFF